MPSLIESSLGMTCRRWFLAMFALIATLPAADQIVTLKAPLSTIIEAPSAAANLRCLAVELTIPADAPTDLGVSAFTCDRHGRWFQQLIATPVTPGHHTWTVDLDHDAPLIAEPERSAWTPDLAVTSSRAGIVLWSAQTSAAHITCQRLEFVTDPATTSPSPIDTPSLHALHLDHVSVETDTVHINAGERWSLTCIPNPLPKNPYDHDEFSLDLLVTTPAGQEQTISGFWMEPMAATDRGDREIMMPAGQGNFSLRFRPTHPGRYQLRLRATWEHLSPLVVPLPDLEVGGSNCDPFVRVDTNDPRFFAVDGQFYWPIGLNINNPYDTRCRDNFHTTLTPARGTQVYHALFERCAAAGINACEIWMSSWNVALEWRSEWPNFRGLGRYNQANAARLDAILDDAWNHGIRVNLVINNHGQASKRNDREWKDNPYNKDLGGPLDDAEAFFTAPAALAGQEQLRRYIIARWADHPAVLGWKLWSEVQLSAAGDAVVPWHEKAAARWKELDPYDHPVTTHWAGTYRSVHDGVCRLPGIDYLCIDAYRNGKDSGWQPLAPLLVASTVDAKYGLSRFKKPVLTTEYGGSSGASPEGVRDADLRSAGWASLVSGHLGTAMCWWWEWVDQTNRWQPYQAVQRFIHGEDLRGADASSVKLRAHHPNVPLWAQAWVRPGRMLIYVQDPAWGISGGVGATIKDALLDIGTSVAAGDITCEWWDADRGTVITTGVIAHPGGELTVPMPPFAGHVACKLWRKITPSPTTSAASQAIIHQVH